MPSANKTPNCGLNQWQGNEYPKRQDFVDDNAKIDAELKKAGDHRNDTNNPHHVTAAQVGAAQPSDIPTHLPNPQALTINQGYGGQTGTYDGSAAKTISVPHITLNTAAPTATLADGELWGVYNA